MNEKVDYLLFLENKGRHLSEINPGSKEIAIPIYHAFSLLEILKDNEITITGGDVLTTKDDVFQYVIHAWGYEYIDLN